MTSNFNGFKVVVKKGTNKIKSNHCKKLKKTKI